MTGKALGTIPLAMITAFLMALGQLGDRRILAVLVQSIAITLAVFVVLGWGGYFALGGALDSYGVSDAGLQGVLALLATVLGGWLLFRLVALAVLEQFADQVIAAVEERHYPAAAALAQPLGWSGQARVGFAALLRTLLYNIIALPVALVLSFTVIGAPLVFAAVNAITLGRELSDMVALRHRGADGSVPRPAAATRFVLGMIVVALLIVPFVNLFAPVIGAAMATHLVHRRRMF